MANDPLLQLGVTGGAGAGAAFLSQVLALLKQIRGITSSTSDTAAPFSVPATASIVDVLATLAKALASVGRPREADTLEYVVGKCTDAAALGGLGLTTASVASDADQASRAVSLVEVWLEALNSEDRVGESPAALPARAAQTRPMTMAAKIIAHHTIGGCPVEGIRTGDVVRIALDWVIASELTWTYMLRTIQQIGAAHIWRNDRFWLAADHVVDPKVYGLPKVQALIRDVERANTDYKMTDYQGLNYTIMHTEFVRERVEPGMLVLGADSHTCSSGAVGCLAIGLGAADVGMGLVTGETWLKVPDSIQIEFVGKPAFGMGGKEVILYILQELKRNTVAADRIVEFTGPGLQHLSIDARFAIANMCAELGAVTGIFAADAVTFDYVARRRQKQHRSHSLYFQADPDAAYAGRYTIDLTQVQSTLAVYPSPDAVVPVAAKADMKLDGVFIGACTTTEEDLVLAALVLQVGLRWGLPRNPGRRHVAPGSLPIVETLRKLGLLDIYTAAGFVQSPPGCSFCVGMGSDKAGEGETWLSSQNRNFKNRMGKGALGSITSAIVVAASSFSMTVTDPAPFLAEIDLEVLQKYKGAALPQPQTPKPIVYMEPHVGPVATPSRATKALEAAAAAAAATGEEGLAPLGTIKSRVVVLGDFIDTDAIAPSEFLVGPVPDDELGTHCLQYTHPDFRDKVKAGQRVVVAGKAFGCGSSRQHAVGCLVGAGVQCVIARSFSFIYGRNQPTLGLLGFTMQDDAFYAAAEENAEIEVDVPSRTIRVGGQAFAFQLTDMEYQLTANRGMIEAYKKFGNAIWEKLTDTEGGGGGGLDKAALEPADTRLSW